MVIAVAVDAVDASTDGTVTTTTQDVHNNVDGAVIIYDSK